MTFVVKKRKMSQNFRLSHFIQLHIIKNMNQTKKADLTASFSSTLHYSIHLTYPAYQYRQVELANTS